MRIYLNEISEQGMDVPLTQTETWVKEAVACLDEESTETAKRPVAAVTAATDRDINGMMSLRKVDEVVVVRGDVHTQVKLLCSRCANSFDFACDSKLSGLFCRDRQMAGVDNLIKGKARHAHDDSGDLEITYLEQDYLDLKDVLTETLRLEIPYQPLCSDDCKGVCPRCGTNLNTGRCACAKIHKDSPFSVLKDLKKELKKNIKT